MAPSKDHYQILGVSKEATEREIKRAYHRLARKLHPDKASTPEEASKLEGEFSQISRAYNILKDSAKRKEYDERQSRKEGQPKEEEKRVVRPRAEASEEAESKSSHGGEPSRQGSPEGASGTKSARRDEASDEARSGIAKKAYNRGMQLYNVGEYGKAVEYFEAAIKNAGSEPLYYARLGKTLMNARRSFTRARQMVLKAIELDPYNIEYRLVLGEICEMAGSTSLAEQAYQEVLRWEADNTKANARLSALRKGKSSSLVSKLLSRFQRN